MAASAPSRDPEIVVRPATAADAAALSALARETFVETFVSGFALPYAADDLAAFLEASYAPSAVAAWVADADAQVLVAARADGGDLVGYAHVGANSLPQPEARAGDGELKRLYVRRGLQGSGLGRRLMDTAMALLLARDAARVIYVGVWSGNLKAQAFYARYGFALCGAYKFAVGNTLDDERIMVRRATTTTTT